MAGAILIGILRYTNYCASHQQIFQRRGHSTSLQSGATSPGDDEHTSKAESDHKFRMYCQLVLLFVWG